MASVTSCYVKQLPDGQFNNSSFGGELFVDKKEITPSLAPIKEDNEYASPDGWKAPRWNRTQPWNEFINDHGINLPNYTPSKLTNFVPSF